MNSPQSPIPRQLLHQEVVKKSDKILASEAQGSPSAFAELYRRHLTNVYRYLFSRVGNVDDAQDLTTQTFLAAKESIASYQGRGSFVAWLMGIARRKAVDRFRRRRKTVPLTVVEQLSSPDPPIEENIDRQLRLESIFENFIRTNSDMVGSKTLENPVKRPPLTEKQKQDREELKKLQKKWENQQLKTSTVAEMEAKIGYDLKEPAFIPTGYVSDDEIRSLFLDVVMLGYKNHQNNARILITQKRLDGKKIIGPILQTPSEKYNLKGNRISTFFFPPQPNTLYGSKDPALQQVDKAPVGVSAKIESVQIGQFTGEYVEGAWDSIYSQDGSSTSGMEWNQNAPLRQLQWKEGNMLYHIASTNELDRDELVAIANSMK